MLLPRLVTQGLFADGLLYSSIARNLAEGGGSWWSPFFSSGYWLDGMPTTYFENPPAFLWFESLFFRLLGDGWWVEKFVSLLVTVLNASLIVAVWRAAADLFSLPKNMAWLALLGWYFIPRVIWGNPNNLMDPFQLVFCLAGLLFFLMNLRNNRPVFLLLAGLAVFGGILAKGPVVLYLLAAPGLFWLFFNEKCSFFTAVRQTAVIAFTGLGSFAALLFFNPAARLFFDNYWQQRLRSVILGSRPDSHLEGWQRLEILETLAVEIAPLVSLLALFFLVWKWQNRANPTARFAPILNWKLAAFFAFLGLAGSLPIVASAKQSGIYLLPSLPVFALTWSFASLHFFEKWMKNGQFSIKINRILTVLAIGLLVGACLNIASIAGKPGREKPLLANIELLKNRIPPGSQVGVCAATNASFVSHCYLQRFLKVELTTAKKAADDGRFFLFEMEKTNCQPPVGWTKTGEAGPVFQLFER